MNDQGLIIVILAVLALGFGACVSAILELKLREAQMRDRHDAMHRVLVNIHERLELVSAQSIDTAKHVGGQDRVISTLADKVLNLMKQAP